VAHWGDAHRAGACMHEGASNSPHSHLRRGMAWSVLVRLQPWPPQLVTSATSLEISSRVLGNLAQVFWNCKLQPFSDAMPGGHLGISGWRALLVLRSGYEWQGHFPPGRI
jgi:hypothetical protein